LLKEGYFFAMPADALQRKEFKPILSVLQSPAFRSKVAALKGYEAARTGDILRIEDAFQT
jgi:hypothetical protein